MIKTINFMLCAFCLNFKKLAIEKIFKCLKRPQNEGKENQRNAGCYCQLSFPLDFWDLVSPRFLRWMYVKTSRITFDYWNGNFIHRVLIENLLCAEHCADYFMFIISTYPHFNSIRLMYNSSFLMRKLRQRSIGLLREYELRFKPKLCS